MKKFLVSVLLFSSVLIVLAVAFECMQRRIPNTYRFTRELIENRGGNISTAVIGSSVVNCGLDPALMPSGSYNLAISGEWLCFNRKLLERYAADMPHLRTVVLGIAYQTLWSDDDPKADVRSVVSHKIYMDIRRDGDWWPGSEVLSAGQLFLRKWSKWYLRHKPTLHNDSLGLDHGYDLSERKREWKEDIPDMLAGQSEQYAADCDKALYRRNVAHLEAIAAFCRERGIALLVVVPPVHRLYAARAGAEQLGDLRAALRRLAQGYANVRVFDYFADDRFGDDDFYNGNHLSADCGAQKFTRIFCRDAGLE